MPNYAPKTRRGAGRGGRSKRQLTLAEAMRAQGLDEEAIAGRLVRLVNEVDGSYPEEAAAPSADQALGHGLTAVEEPNAGSGSMAKPVTSVIAARPDGRNSKMRLEALKECSKMLDDARAADRNSGGDATDPLESFLRNVPRPRE